MHVTRYQRTVAIGLGASLAGGLIAATAGTAAGAPRAAVRTPAAAAPSRPAAHHHKLVGTFTIKRGRAHGKKVSGSYFRMITPVGSYFSNSSSHARGGTYTLLKPGTNKGLRTGTYQPQPSRAFDNNGNSLAGRIIKPTNFENVKFAVSTAKVDPQTGTTVRAPRIKVSGHKLTGDVRAFAASWNKQNFNQGSPKPNGAYSGHTTKLRGKYHRKSHKYSLTWRSQIVGGPFNGFSGLWHLTGTFHAR
ncbi:MAG: hypothetical protein JO246_17345 [Frankiaceae bacterium]|nr:hypothetical protein [Frankiaceae bacterium]MBV9869282.1 hypothetical protein [Frankiaceae bacterium]